MARARARWRVSANGLLLPRDGHVLVGEFGTDDQNQRLGRAVRVGLLFQDPDHQIVGATVEDDVAFGLENLGVGRAEMKRRVETILEIVGLAGERETGTHLLSGGQKQRLALAGVLVLRPSVLVLDEPTSMLDPLGREEILGFVRGLASEGVAVLLITQHMDEAVVADRLMALDGGRVVFQGAPREFFLSEVIAQLPLGDPPTLGLVRELEAVLGQGCGGRWAGDAPPLTEAELLAALRRPPGDTVSASTPDKPRAPGTMREGREGLAARPK